MHPRRVLLVLTEFPPAIGGMQTHALLLSKRLHQRGMELRVYTYRPHDDAGACAALDASLPFPVLRTLSRVSYAHTLDLLREAVRSFGPDLIYSSTVYYGILQDLTGVRTVCRSVGNDLQRPWIVWPFKFGARLAASALLERHLHALFRRLPRPELVEVLLRRRRLALATTAARAASRILANSDYTRRLLLDHGVPAEGIDVVVGGVDAAFFDPPASLARDRLVRDLGLPRDRLLLLTACRLVDKKGVDFLLRALARYRRERPHAAPGVGKDLHLVVVGDGRRRNRFQALAEDLGVGGFVTFVGAVAYERMPAFYWAADVFVLASTVFRDPVTGLCDAETMGRVLCEANASGTPVLASRSGGIPSVIQHGVNGLLFAENDPEDCFAKLAQLLETERRTELVRHGRRLAAERFDWEHILRAHEAHFQAC